MEQSREIAAQMEQALGRFNEALEQLRPALEAIMEAIREWVRIVIEHIKRIFEAFQRYWLYVKLIHWHVPHCVAKFIAERWPKRWLPAVGDWRG